MVTFTMPSLSSTDRACFTFFLYDPSSSEIYTLSLHDALPISARLVDGAAAVVVLAVVAVLDRARMDLGVDRVLRRSEEHTSELQSLRHLVCRLLLEKKNGIGR